MEKSAERVVQMLPLSIVFSRDYESTVVRIGKAHSFRPLEVCRGVVEEPKTLL